MSNLELSPQERAEIRDKVRADLDKKLENLKGRELFDIIPKLSDEQVQALTAEAKRMLAEWKPTAA